MGPAEGLALAVGAALAGVRCAAAGLAVRDLAPLPPHPATAMASTILRIMARAAANGVALTIR
jgi:hypothetical protein